MINTLTQEQEQRLIEYRENWIKIGLDTKRANRSVAEDAAKRAYIVAGLDAPKLFIWVDSPIGGLMAAKLIKEISKKYTKTYVLNQVRDQVRDQVWNQVGAQVCAQVGNQVGDQVRDQVWNQVSDQVRDQVGAQVCAQVGNQVSDQVRDQVWNQVLNQVSDQVLNQALNQIRTQVSDQGFREEWNDLYFYGSMDAYWLSFYSYFLEVCKLEICKKLEPLMTLSKEVGFTWFYKNAVIFSEKPIEINRNDRNQLHNFNGPAIKWADGYEINVFNGVRLPDSKYVIRKDFTKEDILSEKNADIRREITRKIGIEKTIEVLGAEVIDTFESKIGGLYELLLVDYDGRGKRPYLKMFNPSMKDVVHIEGIKPGIKTCKEALAYRMGIETYVEPQIIT